MSTHPPIRRIKKVLTRIERDRILIKLSCGHIIYVKYLNQSGEYPCYKCHLDNVRGDKE